MKTKNHQLCDVIGKSLFSIGTIAFVALLISSTGCTTTEKQPSAEKPPAIQPPFAELVPTFTKFTVDAALGDTLLMASGTRIMLPPNALLDDSGRVATGQVELKYREYHNALDVFLSGIPMNFKSRGEERVMQTAGMFEIRAEKDGKGLHMAENKRMDVEFASFQQGGDYNFYAYDEGKEEWAFVDYVKPVVNPVRELINNRINELTPAFKVPFDKNCFVLNYNVFIDVYYNDDYFKIFRNKDKNKAAHYGLKVVDLKGGSVSFKGNSYPAALMVWRNLSGYGLPAWTKGRQCDLEALGGNVYRISVSDNIANTTASITAECIIPLKYLFKFTLKQWKNDFEQAMSMISVEEERLRQQSEVIRTVRLSGFGIFNYDKLMKVENPVPVAASFSLEKQAAKPAFPLDMVFCLPGDNKTVVKLPSSDWGRVCLDPADENFRIFSVLPGNRVAVYPLNNYRKINFGLLRRLAQPRYSFVLEEEPTIINSKADLEKLLNI